MIVTDKRIKIIKSSERHERRDAPAEKSRAHTPDATAGAKRDAVTVISGWVRELRRKKVAEAGRGFESLFSPQAAGATRG